MEYPLSEDPTNEDFSAVHNRTPMTVEIVDAPAQLAVVDDLSSSMVVLCGVGLATTLTAAVGRGGAKTVKVFGDVAAAADYAENNFRHPLQRVLGGEEGPGAEVRKHAAPLPLPARPRPAAANRAPPRPPQAAREAARTGQPADGAFVSAGLGVSQPSAEETQTPRLGTRAAQCVRPARFLRATSRPPGPLPHPRP